MSDILKVMGNAASFGGLLYLMNSCGPNLNTPNLHPTKHYNYLYNRSNNYNTCVSKPCRNNGSIENVVTEEYTKSQSEVYTDNNNLSDFDDSKYFGNRGLVMADKVANLFNKYGRISYKSLSRDYTSGLGGAGLSFYALENAGFKVPSKYKTVRSLEHYLNSNSDISKVEDSAKIGDVIIMLNNSGQYSKSGIYLGHYKTNNSSSCHKFMYVDKSKGLTVGCILDNDKIRGVWRSKL